MCFADFGTVFGHTKTALLLYFWSMRIVAGTLLKRLPPALLFYFANLNLDP